MELGGSSVANFSGSSDKVQCSSLLEELTPAESSSFPCLGDITSLPWRCLMRPRSKQVAEND